MPKEARSQLGAVLALLVLVIPCGLAWAQGNNIVPPVSGSSPTGSSSLGKSTVSGIGKAVELPGKIQGGAELSNAAPDLLNADTLPDAMVAAAKATAGTVKMLGVPGEPCARLVQGVAMNAQCNGTGNALIQENLYKCEAIVGAALACAAATAPTECGAIAAFYACGKATDTAISLFDDVRSAASSMTAHPPSSVPAGPNPRYSGDCASQPCLQADTSGRHEGGEPRYDLNPWSMRGDDGTTPVANSNLAMPPALAASRPLGGGRGGANSVAATSGGNDLDTEGAQRMAARHDAADQEASQRAQAAQAGPTTFLPSPMPDPFYSAMTMSLLQRTVSAPRSVARQPECKHRPGNTNAERECR